MIYIRQETAHFKMKSEIICELHGPVFSRIILNPDAREGDGVRRSRCGLCALLHAPHPTRLAGVATGPGLAISPLEDSVDGPVRLNIRRPTFEPRVGPEPPRTRRRTKESSNPYEVLTSVSSENGTMCARSSLLRRKAQKIVKLLRVDQSLKAQSKLPSRIVCGSLRTSIRSIYASNLTLVQELSIKTATKAEAQPCQNCEVLSSGKKLMEWQSARLQPLEWSSDHLSRFGRAFAENVPKGWNNRKSPYIPNGNSTLLACRREGGNWVDQPFSDKVNVKLIYSSGKPRIVTLYSEFNIRVLTPLHHSLYAYLKGRNWLLVGSPTDERLSYLRDGCSGSEWLSFDYEQATDKIKTVYVRKAVDVLIERSEGLSTDELRCLEVFSNLSLEDGLAQSGQPMGSPMSFPLLCLINKAIVDLALTDLLNDGTIPFKEWTGHRCLINGDDLLTLSTSKGDLVEAVARNGLQVGLVTNREKTLRSPEYGEINSTVFKNCIKQKKTNVSALWMAAEVSDSLGFAEESCVTPRGFRMVARANATRLARQKIKTISALPCSRRKIVMSTKSLRDAISSRPSSRVPKETNLFSVEVMPDNFAISREEEFGVVTQEVIRIKELGLYKGLFSEKRRLSRLRKSLAPIPETVPLRRLWARLEPKEPDREARTLSCLARYWEKKQKETLLVEDASTPRFSFTAHHTLNPFTADLASIRSAKSGIGGLQAMIRTFHEKRNGGRPKEPPGRPPDPLRDQCGFVSLSDERW
jgi:hypothetical protein